MDCAGFFHGSMPGKAEAGDALKPHVAESKEYSGRRSHLPSRRGLVLDSGADPKTLSPRGAEPRVCRCMHKCMLVGPVVVAVVSHVSPARSTSPTPPGLSERGGRRQGIAGKGRRVVKWP
jgi:hypothetical protein